MLPFRLSLRAATFLAGLPFTAWGQPAVAPLHQRDQIAVNVIFSYGDSHTRTLKNGASTRFESERSGNFDGILQRYRAYAGVDSFKLEDDGKGAISVGDSIIYNTGGGVVANREAGSGPPVDCAMTAHIDTKRGTYSLVFEIQTRTTVTLTGPGAPPTVTPNVAGLHYATGDLPLPRTGDVIRGHAVFESQIGSGRLGTNLVPQGQVLKQFDGAALNRVHVRWQLGRPGPKPPLELVLSVKDYASWIPQGPTPESASNAPGNTAVVTAKLRRKDGGTLERGAVTIRFELLQSSAEPGACLNFPIGGQTGPHEFDLKFVDGNDAKVTDASGQVAETPVGDWRQATATLGSFDWGSYGRLTATAYVPDYGDVLATVEGTNERSIAMPKRSPGSNIADAWKQQNGAADLPDTDDSETSPGNKNDGDGLSLYEEYRGLIARGRHSRNDADARLDPKLKNLIVLLAKQGRTANYSYKGVPLTFAVGPIGGNLEASRSGGRLLGSAIGNTFVVFADQDEVLSSRELNANSVYGKINPQHGVLLYSLLSGDGEVGAATPLDRTGKTPKTTDFVAIDFAGIAGGYEAQRRANEAGGLKTPYTLAQEIANTVAHELAHSCGAAHHGDNETSGPVKTLTSEYLPPRYRVIGVDGVEIDRKKTVNNPDGTTTVTYRDYEIQGSIAPDSSRASGDLSCLMAYANYYAWRLLTLRGQGYVWKAMVPQPMGTMLCTGRDSHPPNEHFGPADRSRGNCRAKIRIKDD